MILLSDISIECCAWLGSRVEDGSLPPGDVLLADVRDLRRWHVRPYRQVHLFAGIGGMPLGFDWAGWPESVSLLTGGFPCPDISAAGKGAGIGTKENPTARSGLFWELVRVLELYQPDVALVENVGALSRRGLDVVAAALGEAGYLVPDAYRVGAWALGAPHERERWWIVCWRRSGENADASVERLRAERECEAGAEPHEPGEERDAGSLGREQAERNLYAGESDADRAGEAKPDSGRQRRRAGRGIGGDEEGAGRGRDQSAAGDQVQPDARRQQGRIDESERESQGGVAAGWSDPVTGPWRRERDDWMYAGPPVFVYRSGAGREERDAAALAGDSRFAPRRPNPTLERGWPVPVLPGFEQRDWEEPRLYQRGVGRSVHGLPGRLADALNKCGVMAVGNAVVPEVVEEIARGMMAAMGGGEECEA